MENTRDKKLTKKDRPTPINEEIIIPDEEVLISVTDPKGIIIETNDIFTKISGYSDEELIGSSHNIIRHPDMPKIMFKIVWDHIMDKENVMAVVKNLAKDGKYYWVVTDFVTRVDADRNIINYTAYRRPVHDKVKQAVIPLYKALCAIEDVAGMDSAEKFLNNYFGDRDTNYDDMIEEIIVKNCDKAAVLGFGDNPEVAMKTMSKEKKQSLFNKLFGIK
ncbi:MAG: PAS domain S-box protein [Flavobacteriaceae bacterium]|nr:PAS domain S-box protein [Flavobacteriaceae bacterium]